MDSFFSDLKAAREASGISLNEIADATLINIKMLEALERGDVGVVPQAYMRAFIREYSSVIGLDPSEVMDNYDGWLKGKSAEASQSVAGKPQTTEEKIVDRTRRERIEKLMPTFFKVGAAIVVLILVDIVLWSVLEKEPSRTVKEVPFSEVVRENERRAGVVDTVRLASADSIPAKPPPGMPVIVPDKDMMTLVAVTSDSVWMQIIVDDTILTEHFLYPNTTFRWKARKEFWISAIGNPDAIKLALNNKPIAIPIRPGFVTRDLRLTRDSLRTR